MNKDITIDVSELTKSTITRERGNEAFENLEKIIKDNSPDIVTIDLTISDMVSLSFLDGIIVNIQKKLGLRRVKICFIVKNEDILKKLKKVVTLRGFKGYHRYANEDNVREIEKIRINSNMHSEVVKDKETMIQVWRRLYHSH